MGTDAGDAQDGKIANEAQARLRSKDTIGGEVMVSFVDLERLGSMKKMG